jgi:hypothetical protein
MDPSYSYQVLEISGCFIAFRYVYKVLPLLLLFSLFCYGLTQLFSSYSTMKFVFTAVHPFAVLHPYSLLPRQHGSSCHVFLLLTITQNSTCIRILQGKGIPNLQNKNKIWCKDKKEF